MFAKASFTVLLLLSASCLVGAEEGLEFPNYIQASVTLPGSITVKSLFSEAGNYCICPVADTLYHMELNHGRIHGRTPLPGSVTFLERSGASVFAVAGMTLCRIEGFQIAAQAVLSQECTALTICGSDPLLLMEDGTLVLRNAGDLTPSAQGTPDPGNISLIRGFADAVCIASDQGLITTLSVPGFTTLAENTFNGDVLFLEKAGKETLLFSTDMWNEVASCSPMDLEIDLMYTFPSAPVQATADSSLSFIYAVCPGFGVQVCRSSGEIAWISPDYGEDARVTLAEDMETAVITTGSRLDILIK